MKRYARGDEYSYALGMTLVFELLQNKKDTVEAVYVHPDARENEHLKRLLSLCEKSGKEVKRESKIFNIVSPKENCFVLARFKKYSSPLERDKPHIVLASPSNSGNVGTVMRSALGFGYENIALLPPCVDLFSPETVRASMGAIFSLNVEIFENIDSYITRFPSHKLYPFMLTASVPIETVKFAPLHSLVFGNEAHGLDESYAALGQSVIIPCSDKIDSLNLSVAAAIGMYEARKTKE